MTFNPVKKIDEFEPVKKVDEDIELSPSVTDPDYGKYTLGRTAAQVGGGIFGGAAMVPSANPGAIIAGIGLGGAIGGQVYDLSREALGEKKPESLIDRATTAAWDFNLDVISQHAFKAGFYGAKKVGGFVVDKVGKKIFPKAELLNDFKEFGIEPSVAQATGSRLLFLGRRVPKERTKATYTIRMGK